MTNTELKAHVLLSEIRNRMLWSIISRLRHGLEYKKGAAVEELVELVDNICNPGKWDYIGLLNKEDKAVMEVLEYILDERKTSIEKYKEWKIPVYR